MPSPKIKPARKFKEKIPGGLASGKSPADFDPKALAEGVKVELEHTSDKRIATEIAMDHLTEDPCYYQKLKKIEKAIRTKPYGHVAYTRRTKSGNVYVPAKGWSDEDKKTVPWSATNHGGRKHVARAVTAAFRMAKRLGLTSHPCKFTVGGGDPQGEHSANHAGLHNCHWGHTQSYEGAFEGLKSHGPSHIAVHELAHRWFSENPDAGREAMRAVEAHAAKHGPLTFYHAFSDHHEGLMEAAALHELHPKEMETRSPELYSAVHAWLSPSKKIEKAVRAKPYGHEAYTRRTKTGKIVQVEAKGVKPREAPKSDTPEIGSAIDVRGREGKIIAYEEHHDTVCAIVQFESGLKGLIPVPELKSLLAKQKARERRKKVPSAFPDQIAQGGVSPVEKADVHIDRVRDGRAVRAKEHAGAGAIPTLVWLDSTVRALTGLAARHLADGLQQHQEPAHVWLVHRGITLPTVDDASSAERIKAWLHKNGPAVFALGGMLVGPRGETLASPGELPAIERALVFDLSKARTKGALGELTGGKHGVLVSSDPSFEPQSGGVRRLKEHEAHTYPKIIERYAAKRVSVIYYPPGTKVDREMLASSREQKLRRQQMTETPAAPAKPVLVIPKPTVDALAEQRAAHGEKTAEDVLYERLEKWTPAKATKFAADPKSDPELQKLIARRDEVMRQIDEGTAAKVSAKEATLLSQDYAIVDRRIRELMGRAHSTGGKGLTKISEESVKLLGAFKRPDLGINPVDNPVSYLISLGWKRQTPDGLNKISDRENDALLHEYTGLINRAVGHYSRKYKLQRDATDDLRSVAVEFILDAARRWTIASRGEPDASNNFQAYIVGSLPHAVGNEAQRVLKRHNVEVEVEDDIDTMPLGPGGSLRVPSVRPEGQEEAVRRKEVQDAVEKVFSAVLSPLEAAVVSLRLNFDGQREGTLDIREVDPNDASKRIVAQQGVRPWDAVLKMLREEPRFDERLQAVVNAMPRAKLVKVYEDAIRKLQASDTGISHEERRQIADYATAHRLFLEGLRHEIWAPGEALAKLKVRVDPVAESSLKELEAHRDTLWRQIKDTPAGDARDALVAQQREVAHKIQVAKQARKKRLTPAPSMFVLPYTERVARDLPRRIEHDKDAVAFWSHPENAALASTLGIGLDYATYRTTPGVKVPLHYRNQREKAERLFATYRDFANSHSSELKQAAKTATQVGIKKIAEHLLQIRDPQRKQPVVGPASAQAVKSLVFVDFRGALQSLAEEVAIWDLIQEPRLWDTSKK